MRLAVVSNLFPPLVIGGYELGAGHVVAELRRRGHEVLVLTASEYRLESAGYRPCRQRGRRPGVVDAGLCVFGSFPNLLRRDPLGGARALAATLSARRRYLAALRAFRPERVLLFNPFGLVAPVLDDCAAAARAFGAEAHAYVSDHWLAEWPYAQPVRRVLGRLEGGRLPLRLTGRLLRRLVGLAGFDRDPLPAVDSYHFCSRFVADASRASVRPGARCGVLHWGLPGLERLTPAPPGHFDGPGPLAVVYAGQLEEHKGLAVLLRALALCRRPHPLVVCGDDTTPHAAACKRLAAELGLAGRVRFLGRVGHAELPGLLPRLGQVLAVPSVWDEPFSLVVLEGLAAGLPVVASATGGTPEAVAHGDTGLLVSRGSAEELAAALNALEDDRALCRRLGARARADARARFSLGGMVEALLGDGETPGRLAA
jgi:glycosyltransferase involved in cell wall biosynthesis